MRLGLGLWLGAQARIGLGWVIAPGDTTATVSATGGGPGWTVEPGDTTATVTAR